MRWVVGRIQIDRDATDFAAQPPAMAPDHKIRQRFSESVEVFRANGILKTRQRRLRSQGSAVDRVAPQQRLVDRVSRETSSIVAVGVTAREPESPLSNKVGQRVGNLPLLTIVGEHW